jgi:hypothetical protein
VLSLAINLNRSYQQLAGDWTRFTNNPMIQFHLTEQLHELLGALQQQECSYVVAVGAAGGLIVSVLVGYDYVKQLIKMWYKIPRLSVTISCM